MSGVPSGAILPLEVVPSPGRENRTYRVTDLAGNTLTIVLQVGGDGGGLQAKLISWNYQNAASADAPRNQFNLDWKTNGDGSFRELNQLLSLYAGQDRQAVTAAYDPVRNETTIRDQTLRQTFVRPGLVSLKLSTNGGTGDRVLKIAGRYQPGTRVGSGSAV